MDACDRLKNWEDLDVTREEIEDLTKCLKQDDFRKLLIEYAEEVTNPENRKIYEKEIGELERERGIDVKFINPEPGYVIKTSVNGDKKCFINVSKSDIVGKPTSQPSYEDGNRGLQWSIPFTLAPPRDDVDKKKNYCTVFDVVFHPDTLYLATKNSRFREVVNDTAMDGVEKNFKVKLDRNNLKYPKMNFKGITQSTVIRKKLDKPPSSDPPQAPLDIEPEIYQKLMSSYDESREKYAKKFEDKPSRPSPPTTYLHPSNPPQEDCQPTPFTTPKFLIKHQTDLDIQDFQTSKNSKLNSTIPKNLVIIIDLPLLRSSSDATLDVQERLLTVTSEKPAKYRLELPLSYRVDPDHGNAKFDPKKRKLTVTLPVIRELKIIDPIDDSGVESDHGSPPLESSVDKAESSDESSENTTELITEIREISEPCETNGETEDSVVTGDSILSSNIRYSLPQFTCNIYDNTLAVTVHVKNVDANSIKHKFLANQSGIHLAFSSVGAGFFPMYYALCLKIRDHAFGDETVGVEPWDNNVVFTVGLRNVDGVESYRVGIDEEFMERKDLPHVVNLDKKFESLEGDDMNINGHRKIEVIPERDEVVVNVKAQHGDSDDEENFEGEEEKFNLQKYRSVSESSGDEVCGSSGSRCRGILKYRRSNFSRSVSESSIDDTAGLASSIDFNYDSVQEVNSESDCCSLKKTVRFNDVVSRQLYRSNSSILGRRKKNQRKLRKKKQAFERRMSESENSETEDRDKYKIETKEDNDRNKNNENVKPILNRDKLSVALIPNNEGKKSNDNVNTSPRAEFKNDLIFDLDM
ncbi:protein kintoun [Diachasma alloeum]|uniref:protein kintoun n=1 Tax=Diachasma alloeum TaxID=454923 RepID=UPI0007384A78|nr:protein kintoun [Diachasma alloeum]